MSIGDKSPLVRNNDKIPQITQPMRVAVYMTDRTGLITYYNDRAVMLWGRKPGVHDRFSGAWKLYKVVDGTPLPFEEGPMARALLQGTSTRNEVLGIEQPDGTRLVTLTSIDPILGPHGVIEGAVGVSYDITSYQDNEMAVMWLAAIVESSGDAVISKTLNGIITSWNKGAENIFGYTKEEILGKPITIIIPPDRQEEELVILDKICRGETVDHFETIRVTRDGRQINISLTVSPIRGQHGEILGASKIARDITEQVRIKRQMQIYNEQLQQMNRYKDEFISLASHELKTPLTVIKAYLEMIRIEMTGQEEYGAFIDKALRQANKLASLISDLLDISRIEEGKLQLILAPFDLNELINECMESLRLPGDNNRIIYQNVTGPLIVTADRQRIEQVIINLLSNALKYSEISKNVVISATPAGKEVLVKVQDSGIGIPPEDLEKIFSRFFRVEGLSTRFPGLGIGLYVSKDIIERHNGKIWVESELGKGSSFYFTIPG